jgi:hypothetical protein
MRLAVDLRLAAAISADDARTDSFGPDWEVPSESESKRIALIPADASRRCTADHAAGTGSGALSRARAARGSRGRGARTCTAGGLMPQPGSGASPG